MVNCTGKMNDGVYNCYGEYDRSLCYHCTFNAGDKEFEKTGNMFKSYKDAMDELFSFLKGEGLPEGMRCKMPKLPPDMAFTVIWFLQEHMSCLSTSIEMCQSCKCLYDSDSEGQHISDEHRLYDDDDNLTDKPVPKKYRGDWCDSCIPVRCGV